MAFTRTARWWRICARARALLVASCVLPISSTTAVAQQSGAELDSLLARALAASPAIRAARARVDAARAHVAPAGARPDPMLMVGIQNLPLTEPAFSDFMTMKTFGIEQTIPYPGRLARRRRIAEHELAAAEAMLDDARLTVAREARMAYYDLAFLSMALDIVGRNQNVIAALIPVTEARYASGTGGQPEVLRARVEAARLAEEGAMLTEERRAALARLNAVLDRRSDAPADGAEIPIRIAHAAIADSARQVSFASAALGARVTGSPLPTLDDLQALAIRHSPSLRAHEAMIAAQEAQAELARREHLPDFDVSLEYGQRDGLADMLTARVSIPLPIQRRRKQNAVAAEARSTLAALEADHDHVVNEVRAEVARLHSALERDRTQLALYVKAILPQARAAFASGTAAYRVGQANLTTLIESQATLFNYETQYHRVLTDFAKTLAELEARVGMEVLR